MRQFLFGLVLAFAASCECPESENTMKFFELFGATDLGTTKLLVANGTIGQRGDWQKMIDISSKDGQAVPITISLRSEYEVAPGTGLPGIGQPLVGWLMWGVGGAQNQVEFDVPCPKIPTSATPVGFPAEAPMINSGNGVTVSVTASHISLYARHDGNVAPIVNPTQQAALGLPPNDFVGSPGNPAKLLAFVSPGISKLSKLERTLYIAGGNVFPGLLTSELAPLATVDVSVPPFTEAVRFQRGDPAVEPLTVQAFSNNAAPHRTFTVPVNNEDWIPVDSATIMLRVTNMGAAAINRLQAVFRVQPL